MTKNCIYCGCPNFAEAKVCRRCKKELPPACPECGQPVAPDAPFCFKCGTIFDQKKIDVSAYKTKSLRSRSYEQEREEMELPTPGKPSVVYKAKAQQLKKCPECWRNISADAIFCSYCGTRFDQALPESTPPTPSVSVRQPAAQPQPAAPAKTPASAAPAPPAASAKAATQPKAAAQPKTAAPAPPAGPAKPAERPKTTPPAAKPAPAADAEAQAAAAKKKTTEKKKKAIPTKAAPPPVVPLPPKPQKEIQPKVIEPAPAVILPAEEGVTYPSPEEVGLDLKMIYVTAGAFPHPARPGEMLRTRGFYLSDLPVTCAQYKKFCQATGHAYPLDWLDGEPLPGKENHPVILITLLEALAFCRWAGKRLPTSTEWTIASCGLKPARYPWGHDFQPGVAHCNGEGPPTTVPAGRYEKNVGPFGHHDLVGNVRYWTFDPNHEAMPQLPGELPAGWYGLAGASYLDPPWLAAFGRVDHLLLFDQKYYAVGFRCASDR